MPTSAHAVAAELRARDPGLGKLKLHKLLYFCQGQHLASFGQPLFTETISAWDNGPVVGALWYVEDRGIDPPAGLELGEAELNTVGYVVSRYGALSGLDLIHLTHSEDPWRRADRDRVPGTSEPIELSWIQSYFVASRLAKDEPTSSGSRSSSGSRVGWTIRIGARDAPTVTTTSGTARFPALTAQMVAWRSARTSSSSGRSASGAQLRHPRSPDLGAR